MTNSLQILLRMKNYGVFIWYFERIFSIWSKSAFSEFETVTTISKFILSNIFLAWVRDFNKEFKDQKERMEKARTR